jgi:uncharacterized oligopeptide transporter (OPT) family protein
MLDRIIGSTHNVTIVSGRTRLLTLLALGVAIYILYIYFTPLFVGCIFALLFAKKTREWFANYHDEDKNKQRYKKAVRVAFITILTVLIVSSRFSVQ